MATTTTTTNKPLNPRAQDLSPKGYNRAALYSGKALDFDGVNDDISGSNSFSETTHSISAYIQTSSASAYKSIFEFRDSGADGGVIWVLPGNNLVYQINGVSTTNFNVNADEWYHVVGTYDGTNQSIYINGNLWETKTNSGSVLVSANWKIGSRSFSTGSNWFDGMIGGVKLFNTALTTAQVADLYLNPEKIVPDGVASSALKLWLPMMEGAGTTAYDGSGNGNHGTINGATWTAGIGAPVAQTALVSWNKGTNLALYSEQFDNAAWIKASSTITSNVAISPSGYQDADNWVGTAANLYRGGTAGVEYTISVYVKSNGQSKDNFLLRLGNSVSTTFTATSEWQRFSFTGTPTTTVFGITTASAPNNAVDILVWGASITQSSSVEPYIPTLATAQTSPVLLPQGLTANKDITGVNAFESARNPYALNLDGKSWAEVHDNASLDITSAITLEAWVYWNTSIDKGLISKWDFAGSKASYLLYKPSGGARFYIYVSHNGSTLQFLSNNTNITAGWNHLVGIYDGTTLKCYLNGNLDGSTAYNLGIFSSPSPVEVGGYNLSASTLYENQLANPRIYNRALTATEVARNYNADKSKFGL